MKQLKNFVILLAALVLLTSCNFMNRLEQKAASVSNYERAALTLAKENRQLKAQIGQLKYEIQLIKSKNDYLAIKLDRKKTTGRKIASISSVAPKDDLVKFNVYKWTPAQLMSMAHIEYAKKNFEKSAQYYKTFVDNFPGHASIDDEYLFQAGLAAFESGKHQEWSMYFFNRLIVEYPISKYYRAAKLWRALSYLREGDKDKFFQTVEEFRKKYRNTDEWKIISAHYEEILQKYKR
ncbi:MAG: hypothetical protein ISR65_03685 [Bacteriovoracaceae bacterium]|nr:hypothetical protein [Bacteriovoracaceae bacterium]